MKNWLRIYKYPLGLIALFLLLSFVTPIFIGAFLTAIGALASRILFDRGRQQLKGRKLAFIGGSLIVLIFTIWATIYFTPALHTDWETRSPYDGLLMALLGIALLAALMLFPFFGYVGDRIYRTRKLRK